MRPQYCDSLEMYCFATERETFCQMYVEKEHEIRQLIFLILCIHSTSVGQCKHHQRLSVALLGTLLRLTFKINAP